MQKRCRAGLANNGCPAPDCEKVFHTHAEAVRCGLLGHDRCRRFEGHETFDAMEDCEWHLLDCGGALADDGRQVYSPEWMEIFDRVDEDGDIAVD